MHTVHQKMLNSYEMKSEGEVVPPMALIICGRQTDVAAGSEGVTLVEEWLNTLPISSLGQRMDNNIVRVAVGPFLATA